MYNKQNGLLLQPAVHYTLVYILTSIISYGCGTGCWSITICIAAVDRTGIGCCWCQPIHSLCACIVINQTNMGGAAGDDIGEDVSVLPGEGRGCPGEGEGGRTSGFNNKALRCSTWCYIRELGVMAHLN